MIQDAHSFLFRRQLECIAGIQVILLQVIDACFAIFEGTEIGVPPIIIKFKPDNTRIGHAEWLPLFQHFDCMPLTDNFIRRRQKKTGNFRQTPMSNKRSGVCSTS